jgi:hypothetical protein
MDIPKAWTNEDRKNFLAIAQRRQSEHLLGFGVVAVGAQIFRDILTFEQIKIRKAEAEATAESCTHQSTSLAILED